MREKWRGFPWLFVTLFSNPASLEKLDSTTRGMANDSDRCQVATRGAISGFSPASMRADRAVVSCVRGRHVALPSGATWHIKIRNNSLYLTCNYCDGQNKLSSKMNSLVYGYWIKSKDVKQCLNLPKKKPLTCLFVFYKIKLNKNGLNCYTKFGLYIQDDLFLELSKITL